MNHRIGRALIAGLAALCLIGCNTAEKPAAEAASDSEPAMAEATTKLSPQRAQMYAEVELSADLSHLSDGQRRMIGLMIQIADIMDELFWLEAFGEKEPFLKSIDDPATRRFAEINYGPWDRLDGNEPFMEGYGPKPLGARFYPEDAEKAEIEQGGSSLLGLYSVVRRQEDGALTAIPYHRHFADQVKRAADLMDQAAALAEDPGFKSYLTKRAEALRTDDYFESDLAWMDMTANPIDFVVGPIEVYEDKLFNAKAAHEAYILIKDLEWSERLEKYAALLPQLQRGLPVPDEYKAEEPGTNSQLNAYDVVYYAGDCNAGSKTIAINLPNDERVQLQKGSRRLQLKNAMRAKFDQILLPIADTLIAADQRSHVTFDAFFSTTMFHEVAHGLGVKETINGKGTVRKALAEHSSWMEESKADVLGLYMIDALHKSGELTGDLEDYFVTFVASIFRSIRFGAASAHGKANLVRFNFFREMGAFTRDEATGTYRVNFDKMTEAMRALSQGLLTIQGDGDYEGAGALLAGKALIGDQLQKDLDGLAEAGIPTDIVFKQGAAVLGLE